MAEATASATSDGRSGGRVEFYGRHQAGISTPSPEHIHSIGGYVGAGLFS